jgi:hypothetical protein
MVLSPTQLCKNSASSVTTFLQSICQCPYFNNTPPSYPLHITLNSLFVAYNAYVWYFGPKIVMIVQIIYHVELFAFCQLLQTINKQTLTHFR